ncbi:hypothetical protein BdWA1_003178 [Babesia duncani]|uniref:Uncharacterized protein n=1 Tax=Babesia duncani TaxID=323732 RepID=A0AAD9PII5_9APIC|nr:hypothetical protein BdWA1_003178 [Babesia duncani]
MKTINIICIMQLSCFLFNVVIGKNIVLDISHLSSDNDISVETSKMPNRGMQYVFKPKVKKSAITTVKCGSVPIAVPGNGKLKASEVILFKFNSMNLLMLPNPKRSLFKRSDNILFFKSKGSQWINVNKREFMYRYHIETNQTVVFDLSIINESINRTIDKSKVVYTTKKGNIFVVAIRDGKNNIWPQEKQKGGLFLSAKYFNKAKKPLLNVKYLDVDKKEKTSYHMLDGKRWVQLSKKGGKPIK